MSDEQWFTPSDDPTPVTFPEQFVRWHAEWRYYDAITVAASWETYAQDCHLNYLRVLEEGSRFLAADCTYYAQEELKARRKAAEFTAIAVAWASTRPVS